jgi:hypothetical protein
MMLVVLPPRANHERTIRSRRRPDHMLGLRRAKYVGGEPFRGMTCSINGKIYIEYLAKSVTIGTAVACGPKMNGDRIRGCRSLTSRGGRHSGGRPEKSKRGKNHTLV